MTDNRKSLACFEHGADVTAQIHDGRTPFHVASGTGQLEIARLLIDGGADRTAKNEDGETPLHSVSTLL